MGNEKKTMQKDKGIQQRKGRVINAFYLVGKHRDSQRANQTQPLRTKYPLSPHSYI